MQSMTTQPQVLAAETLPESEVLKVALLQFDVSSDLQAHTAKVVAQVIEAASQGSRIICLPELFLTPYLCQCADSSRFDWAEPIPGPTTELFCRVARQQEVVIVLPLFERRAPGVYHNSAVVIDADGTILGTYRKMHIPDDPLYYEKYYFTPGDLGFQTFTTRFGKIGVIICWDQWFPESARLTALHGAELIVCPTAIGVLDHEGDDLRHQFSNAWRTVQIGHAIANGVYYAAINRVGREEGIRFWGQSFLAEPGGGLVALAGDAEEFIQVAVRRRRIEEIRRDWPFFRDRRIDAYQPVQHRWSESLSR